MKNSRPTLYIFLSLVLFVSCKSDQSESSNADFLGSWKLTKWTSVLADGTEVYPYGKDAYGKLIYESNGEMSGIMMADDRALMSSADVGSRKPDEALAAFNSFFAYSGPFEVRRDSGFVLHHVEACINPNWIGVTQKRFFEFKDGNLILSTPPIAVQGTQNQATKQTLIWKKMD